MLRREWDEIDEQMEREGQAVRDSFRSHKPRKPRKQVERPEGGWQNKKRLRKARWS